MYSDKSAHTVTEKGKNIDRFYYIDIKKALDTSIDRIDAIVSVPADEKNSDRNKKITAEFGHKVILDLSDRNKEYENKMFPLNLILKPMEYNTWQMGYLQYHNMDVQVFNEYNSFLSKIIHPLNNYDIPVITLDKNTPKEAVCQVFENVNTGGVSLNVFELVTAVFAMENFRLREYWEETYNEHFKGDILKIVQPTDYLTACTLLSSYKRGGTVSCKKKDVLDLSLAEFEKYNKLLNDGFKKAEDILQEERIFDSRDLPYTSQLIPLAVICALLIENHQISITTVTDKVKQWYWCGVFGELYGGAIETRYVYDVVDVMSWINGSDVLPRTVQDAYFYPTRLLTLQSRLSAAYKGIMALVLKNHCADFISGKEMDFVAYKSESIDIHHIFPQHYCETMKYDKKKWNSIVNKTPITYSTNRKIGGSAPSEYISKIESEKLVQADKLNMYLSSHLINPDYIRNDDFDSFIIFRARLILDFIQKAMGKPIAGRESDDVIAAFGASL